MIAERRAAEARAAWVFLAPALALIGVFFVLPILVGLLLSFTDFDIYAIADPSTVRVVGLENYGLEEGAPASLVVYDAPGEMDAIWLLPRRRLVLRRGQVVARTEPVQTTVTWDGREEAVDFLPAHDSSVSAC